MNFDDFLKIFPLEGVLQTAIPLWMIGRRKIYVFQNTTYGHTTLRMPNLVFQNTCVRVDWAEHCGVSMASRDHLTTWLFACFSFTADYVEFVQFDTISFLFFGIVCYIQLFSKSFSILRDGFIAGNLCLRTTTPDLLKGNCKMFQGI